jgi:hypothetical protein
LTFSTVTIILVRSWRRSEAHFAGLDNEVIRIIVSIELFLEFLIHESEDGYCCTMLCLVENRSEATASCHLSLQR